MNYKLRNQSLVCSILVICILGLSCKKRPFNPRNDFTGEWEFTIQSTTSEATNFDSNGIATEHEETVSDPVTRKGKIRYKNKDVLKFDFGSGEWSYYEVSEEGRISYTDEDAHYSKVIQKSGAFIGSDSMFIMTTQSYNYHRSTTMITGVKLQ